MARETRMYSGVPPMAAISLKLAVAARNPTSTKVAVARSKWMPSASRSVVNKWLRRGFEAMTAASSPMPRSTLGPSLRYRRCSARMRSNSLSVAMALRRGRATILPGEMRGMEASCSCVGCPLGPPRFVNARGRYRGFLRRLRVTGLLFDWLSAPQGHFHDVVHCIGEHELNAFENVFWDFVEIFLVALRQ